MQPALWQEPAPALWRDAIQFPDPLIQAIVSHRFATAAEAAAFLQPPPLSIGGEALPNMSAALARITGGIAAQERMVLFGDYDVDGIAATALMLLALRAAAGGTADIGVRIPTRAEGYGLRPEMVREIAASGATLLICVDCGSSDAANVELAASLGVDVVAFDHHRLHGEPPVAIVVTPRHDETGPYANLPAAGVAYLAAVQLAQAGYDVGAGPGAPPSHLTDLAALGIVADVMPLCGLNRTLVQEGLRLMRRSPRAGLAMLSDRAGVPPHLLTSEDIAFKLAPRLNAAGRMGDPRAALALLLAEAPDRAQGRVLALERLNHERKHAVERIEGAVSAKLRAAPELAESPVVVVHGAGWHFGVLGIVAARLVDRLGRPAVVLADDEEFSRGSARSVPGFDIGAALAEAEGLLIAHGGHQQAAGLTLLTANIPRLEAALGAAARSANVPAGSQPALQIDADLPVSRLTRATAELLAQLEPFGAGNPRPLLRVRQARLRRYSTVGADGRHLKLHVETPQGEVGVIGWSASSRSRELLGAREVDLVLTLGLDHWNGSCRLQAVCKDFRVV